MVLAQVFDLELFHFKLGSLVVTVKNLRKKIHAGLFNYLTLVVTGNII